MGETSRYSCRNLCKDVFKDISNGSFEDSQEYILEERQVNFTKKCFLQTHQWRRWYWGKNSNL